ncbi:hypothetical protein ABKN59_005406 [Abortiporus biennis]
MYGHYCEDPEGIGLLAPPLARHSSSTDTRDPTPLVTPADILDDSYLDAIGLDERGRYPKGAVLDDTVAIRSASIDSDSYGRPRDISGQQFRDPEPYGPYFSLPRASPTSTLSRRSTAKDLIGRFESLSMSSTSSSPVNRPRLYTPEQKKRKAPSPLRQSFRNLLSVFGRKQKSSASEEVTSCHISSPSPSRSHLRIDTSNFNNANNARTIVPCTTPTSLHSGDLLYLANDLPSKILPVWLDCEVSLHSSHILIKRSTAQGNSSTSMITFGQCTDVRSLSMQELDALERSQLPGDAESGLKVFELLFEGRGREKFAAHSVKDRAGWVASIWDAVLQVQESRSCISPRRDASEDDDYSRQYTFSDIPQTHEREVSRSHSKTSTLLDRELPELPLETPLSARPTRISLHDNPVPPPSPISVLTSASSSRSPASTMNLSQRSRTTIHDYSAPQPSPVSFSTLQTPMSTRTTAPSTMNFSQRSRVSCRDNAASEPSPIPSSRLQTPTSTRTTTSSTINLSQRSRVNYHDNTASQPSSALQTPTSTRMKSPSIMNLSQRSMVRQRLADIERTNSQEPSPLSSKSSWKQQIVTPVTPASAKYRTMANLPPCQPTVSTGGDSFIDSYTEYGRNRSVSPIDEIVVQPLPPVNNVQEAAPQTMNDIFSPTSNYSIDDEVVPTGMISRLEMNFPPDVSLVPSLPPTPAMLEIQARSSHPTGPTYTAAPYVSSRLSSVQNSRESPATTMFSLPTPPFRPEELTVPVMPEKPVLNVATSFLTPTSSRLSGSTRRATPTSDDLRPPSPLKIVEQQMIPMIDDETKQSISHVKDIVNRIEGRAATQDVGINGIHTKVDAVLVKLQEPNPMIAPLRSMAKANQVEQVLANLGEFRTIYSNDLPEVFRRLEELRSIVNDRTPVAVVEASSPSPLVMQNVAPTTIQEDSHASKVEAPTDIPAAGVVEPTPQPTNALDLSDVNQKLENLLQLCQTLQSNKDAEISPPPPANDSEGAASEEPKDEPQLAVNNDLTEKINEMLELVKTEQTQRAAQLEQQTDSVRYLNELNSWLEAFVNHGTSQIEQVAAGMQHLCKELGPIPEIQPPVVTELCDIGSGGAEASEEGAEAPAPAPGGNLLSDIRRLLVDNKERENDTAVLQASVNGLIAAVQEDLRRNSESRNMLTTESIVGLIERHRNDQERLLRSVAAELSNDIRGERLRFVEAMKEATAINVQIHVEEFKKELTREVLLMTQEVGRLQKERQTLEGQIADLFGFYAKQKQTEPLEVRQARTMSQPGRPAPSNHHLQVGPPPTPSSLHPRLPSARRRPLPTPTPSPAPE